jgi:hypothetical protein
MLLETVDLLDGRPRDWAGGGVGDDQESGEEPVDEMPLRVLREGCGGVRARRVEGPASACAWNPTSSGSPVCLGVTSSSKGSDAAALLELPLRPI